MKELKDLIFNPIFQRKTNSKRTSNKLIMNKLHFFGFIFLILHPENKNSNYETNW